MPVTPYRARKPSSRLLTRRAAGLVRAVMPSRIKAVPPLRTETSSSEETPFSSTTLLTLPLTANSTAAPTANRTPVEARDGLVMGGAHRGEVRPVALSGRDVWAQPPWLRGHPATWSPGHAGLSSSTKIMQGQWVVIRLLGTVFEPARHGRASLVS